MRNQLSALSDNLNEIISRNVQRMQERQTQRQNLFNPQPRSNTTNDILRGGLGGHTLSTSLNAGDFLQQMGQPQNLIERALGTTPVNLPPVMQDISPQQVQQSVTANPTMQREKTAGERTEEAKAKNARQARIDTETFPYYEKIKNQSSQAPEIDARLDEMDDLLNTGKVQTGPMLSVFDSLKDVPLLGKFAEVIEQSLLTDETRVFKKLSTDFLRDAKPYFGSNMSTAEVMLFLERVPNLMSSTEGNRAVIRNFRAMNNYTKEVDKAMEEIIAENGGERPRHLQSKVSNSPRVKKAGEDLRKAFKESVKLIPNSQVGKKANEFSSLPKAKDYSGKTITDTQTGTKYKSNGTKWVKA